MKIRSRRLKVGTASDGLPVVDLLPPAVQPRSPLIERITADQKMHGRLVGFDRGDDRARTASRVARLLAMALLRADATIAGGIVIVTDPRRRLLDRVRSTEPRAEGTWCHHGNADAEQPYLFRERVRHRLDRELRHVIIADAGIGDEPTDRADIDDTPVPARAHARQHGHDECDWPEQVGLEQRADIVVLAFLDRGEIAVTGIIDENVDPDRTAAPQPRARPL